ncbi:hypothetical protein [Pyrobaculum ferrireducens]|uniref:Uncharacterized protein n=1 Tax=Pyrobaculum ferrireducens TaxID=1104324 RepID=G7VC28_9CREN|nr:hypothetical protein [Pyrobaculum ferrireducens]AET32528.1 hypothetical protein P186_1092 [Pyrobaculum ferrireducens]
MLLHDVLGDGTVTADKVVLYVGGGEEDEVPAEVKADLYYALLRGLGYQPKMRKAGGIVHIKLYGGEARKFARDALPYLVGLERMLEEVKGDEQIYSKVEKMIEMAKAEKVKARVEDFKESREVALEKEASFFKTRGGVIKGYVNIHAGAKGGPEADYIRTAAVLKALGVEKWGKQKRQIRLTGGALVAFMRLEPVCAALGICQKV